MWEMGGAVDEERFPVCVQTDKRKTEHAQAIVLAQIDVAAKYIYVAA